MPQSPSAVVVSSPVFALFTAEWPPEARAAFLAFVHVTDDSALEDADKLDALHHCWRLWAIP